MLEIRLKELSNCLIEEKIDGFIVPSNDAFQSEYVPEYARRLEWLTGFSGSNGVAIVLASGKAAFFTDGRYTIQAQNEVPNCYEIYNLADKKPESWLAEQGKELTIAYDMWLHTEQNLMPYRAKEQYHLRGIEQNPVDMIWKDKPAPQSEDIVAHPLEYAGKSYKEKINDVVAFINDKQADYLLITAPDSICWLLNIRGRDVPCTPLVLSYAFVSKSGEVNVFTESAELSEGAQEQLDKAISVNLINKLTSFIKELRNNIIIYSKASAPIWFLEHLDNAQLVESVDPCQHAKAIKNDVETAGMCQAHIYDGVALTQMLHWLEEALASDNELKETDVADKLIELRSKQPHFVEPSFGTIAGFNGNGAIVHYQAKEKTAATLDNQSGSMLLVDSGGQYLNGTTDITRTIALGEPSDEQKQHFTYVLKGHIALAQAVFPKGTTGSALDALARQYLWQQGLDYQHGTGHGVGSYLGVHEGPQRISKLPSSVALEAGMVLSNEPGYYQAGSHGIRIESLVLVEDHPDFEGFLRFETLSKAPIDTHLIDFGLLSDEEIVWLSDYHQTVYRELSPHLSDEEKLWLERVLSS